MAQFDFGDLESPLSGSDLINTNLEPWRDALHSSHKGSSRPSYVVAGMIWINSTTNPWVVNVYDGSNDVSIGTVNTGTHAFSPSNATPADASITNVKLATAAANTVKTNNTGSTASPSDLAMAASTILARLASGNIVAATTAQIKTLLALANTDISGLGTASTADTGTSGAKVPLLNAVNTFSGAQSMTAGLAVTAGLSTDTLTVGGNAIGTSGRLLNEIYFTQPTNTFTITTASPGVITFGNGGGSVDVPGSNTVNAGQVNQAVVLSTTNTLPTPLAVGTVYYLLAGNKLSLTPGGAAINITLGGSGTHTIKSAPYTKATNNPSFIIVEGVNAGDGSGTNISSGAGTYFRKKILNAALGASEVVDVGKGVLNSTGSTTSFGTAGALASTTVADIVFPGQGAPTSVANLPGGNSYFGGGGANNSPGAPNTGGGSGGTGSRGGSGLLKISEYS